MENSEAAQRLIAAALAAHASGDNEGGDEPSNTDDAAAQSAPARNKEIRFLLRNANPFIVCQLCMGYFVNATTISECLHTFCKSCIVRHFYDVKTCPICNILVHETNPLETLRPDRTMQSLVFKIVEGLQSDEEARERAFYEAQGIHQPAKPTQSENDAVDPARKRAKKMPKLDTVRDEQIAFTLKKEETDESADKLQALDKPFIRTSVRATILHVKKFLALRLHLQQPEDVDILCRGEVMGKEYSLEYVARTRWRKEDQLCLTYRPKMEFQV
eukprot:m.71181 g.71181  ORF g.71181 m.71181 type:complete len:273 (+) comp14350_c0_seq1:202-1020(+)